MFFTELGLNKALWFSILSCAIAQVLKIFTAKEERFELKKAFSSGGMPSSHSSFVTCLATMVGMKNGFSSDIFALTTVFAMITMYDAAGVRLAVGKQAAILNEILRDIYHKKHVKQQMLKELIGHTPKQVIVGGLMGVLIGIVGMKFF